MQPNKIYHGDALEVMKQWPDECMDMVVTSPPYHRLRDYQVEGQLGLEKTSEEYIEKLVVIFREVRRVLKSWGTVWLNIGDNYASGGGSCFNPGGGETSLGKKRKKAGAHPLHRGNVSDLRRSGLKPREVCGTPVRLAEALRADGWWRKSDIIWHKPAPMTESMVGWRWEQHKVKVGNAGRGKEKQRIGSNPTRPQQDHDGREFADDAKWEDCSGCPKCEINDGLVLRKGSGRPTRTYEYIFLLAKSAEYFYDTEAVKQAGANLRNVWTVPTASYPGAHYATFPEELPRLCILAGTSAKGNCKKCGMPWVRIIKVERELRGDCFGKKNVGEYDHGQAGAPYKQRTTRTIGWRPHCKCKADVVPPVVLDPFFGSGTTGKVATDLGRNWVGIEINKEYIEKQAKRRTAMRGFHEAT